MPPILNDGVELKNYILDKLDISEEDFKLIMSQKKIKILKILPLIIIFLKILNFLQKIFYKLKFIPKILYLRYFGGDY